MKLHDLGVDIEQEENAARFLGVNLERDEEKYLLKMKQHGLMDSVTSSVGLDNGMAKVKYTHVGYVPLFNNEGSVTSIGRFNYSRILGIMLCLSGHTRPNIAFAFNCCARYIFLYQAF